MRTSFIAAFLSTFLVVSTRAAAQSPAMVTGVIVDQDARPIPRALVKATDATGRELAKTFTALDGSFTLQTRDSADGCFLEAQLTGFHPVRTDCGTGDVRRIVLPVAPLEEVIIVSATRGEAPAAQVGSSTTVFTAREMERLQRPVLADLLRSSAGTTVVGAGAPGGLTSLFVRGGESSYTKVLLDGIPLNEPGGTFDFSNVSTHHLGRVELVRGAHSAQFGSDAMAGVLQMFTVRARPGDPIAQATFEAGSFGTARGGATYARATHSWDYSLHASGLTTDNESDNNEFTNTTLSAAGGAKLTDRTTIRFVSRAEIGSAGTPGQTAFGRPDLDAIYKRRYVVAGAVLDQQISERVHHAVRYSYASVNQRSTNLQLDPPFTPRFGERSAPFEFFDFADDRETAVGRHHAGYQIDWRLTRQSGPAGEHVLTLAGEWDGERATLEDRLASSALEASRDNVGATLQHQILWPRVFVTAGLRLEHNDAFGFEAVPRASVSWTARQVDEGLFATTKLRASAGAGVKEPTILQSFSTSPFFLGNPDLEPERSRTFDIGIEQAILGGAAKVEVTWFSNRFRNIISTRALSFTPFRAQYFNIGLTRARGVEFAGELSRLSPLHIRGGYTYLNSRVLDSASPSDSVFGVGQPLFRRPRHSGFIEIHREYLRVSGTFIGTFMGRAADSDFVGLSPAMTFNEGHKRWDIRGSYLLSSRLRVLGAIDNVFDNRYMEPLGYPVLGRAARAGLQVTF